MASRDSLLEWQGSFYAISSVLALYLGASSYLYFRLWRYRELAPDERESYGGSAFVRREAANDKTWALRGGLVALFIFMGVTSIPVLLLLMMMVLGIA